MLGRINQITRLSSNPVIFNHLPQSSLGVLTSKINNYIGGWNNSTYNYNITNTTTTICLYSGDALRINNGGQLGHRYFLSSLLSNDTPSPVSKCINKTIKFTPTQIFHVVSNVKDYKEFLPFCMDSKVTRVVENGKCFEAELTVGTGSIQESYTSKVIYHHPTSVEAISISSNLFNRLSFKWQFKEISNNQCRVDCQLEYQFKSSFYSNVMDQFFSNSLESMINAFEKRCKELYR